MVKKVLDYSIRTGVRHIPSALSQLSYLKYLLPSIDHIKWNIVIGKPFGSQAYYIVWEEMGLLTKKEIDNLGSRVSGKEIPFVDYSEETLGNSLGIAAGMALADESKKTYINTSDSVFQIGSTIEAMQFIGKHQLNILCTIDCNETQLTGSTKDILGIGIKNIQNLFHNSNWETHIISPEDIETFQYSIQNLNSPVALIIKTTKGNGVREMEQDPVGWHYQELRSIDEITFS